MADGDQAAIAAEPEQAISLEKFFEETPPGREWAVAEAVTQKERAFPARYHIRAADISLYCPTDGTCDGIRRFRKLNNFEDIDPRNEHQSLHIRFVCRNCQRTIKLYSLLARQADHEWRLWKVGEVPEFGPPTPSRVMKMIWHEKDYYLRGRRCENQGLGIGAFGYYRRVVENQKNRIIDEIIRAAKKIDVPQEMIEGLEAAKEETQFSTAIDKIKPGVPQALLIKGQNPLTLLHSALSQGLHAETDEDCLELATSIRVVLDDLAERTTAVLKDSAELDKALSRLMQWKSQKAQAEVKVP